VPAARVAAIMVFRVFIAFVLSLVPLGGKSPREIHTTSLVVARENEG